MTVGFVEVGFGEAAEETGATGVGDGVVEEGFGQGGELGGGGVVDDGEGEEGGGGEGGGQPAAVSDGGHGDYWFLVKREKIVSCIHKYRFRTLNRR